MADVPLEVLTLEPMASGHRCICLTRSVNWEEFPSYAKRLVAILRGRITAEADAAAERLREVTIEGEQFYLAFDDYPFGVCLEPRDESAGKKVVDIHQRLLDFRSR